jgi:hypothetical protein
LPVPERVLLELTPDTPSDDQNDELADLLLRSVGTNIGLRWLSGARAPTPSELEALDDDFVARVLFLDGLAQNPDRTPQNPNLLLWHDRPWLIDHGAALPFQHCWGDMTEPAARERWDPSHHLFGHRVGALLAGDAALARLFDERALGAALENVPDELLAGITVFGSPARTRAAYEAVLGKRLDPPRPFVPSAESAS